MEPTSDLVDKSIPNPPRRTCHRTRPVGHLKEENDRLHWVGGSFDGTWMTVQRATWN